MHDFIRDWWSHVQSDDFRLLLLKVVLQRKKKHSESREGSKYKTAEFAFAWNPSSDAYNGAHDITHTSGDSGCFSWYSLICLLPSGTGGYRGRKRAIYYHRGTCPFVFPLCGWSKRQMNRMKRNEDGGRDWKEEEVAREDGKKNMTCQKIYVGQKTRWERRRK